MTLPKIINLRLTKLALKAVPESYSGEKDYADIHGCLICQAVRRQFPGIIDVRVGPSRVTLDRKIFYYARSHESRILTAHRNPDKFKPFSIRLTRE